MTAKDFNQRKVTDDYAPDQARQKLTTFFENHPAALETVQTLNRTQVCVLAALLDDKSITTSGYTIPADYGVKRASAVIHALDKEYSFPISSRRVETESDVGNRTKQSLFFITQEDQERLQAEPEVVFKERHDNACRKKESQAQKEIKRLVKEYGEDGVRELLERAANDEAAPDSNAG
ncbi:hypothetical protein OU500_003353 [Yersinia enterocolitica]|uniref:Uncharacterized protein n=1 Tax=Yersinia enterocolitica TaxID=630 RepID=A0A9P1PTH8_YEREN|nr:hypothetical protein [Yersinia enterocolitica]EKN3684892.1 hypothetical protein [Yersinia enterocolitica]EKN3951687.1 hypothetical protein [Yersinia enterocolitica]EKN4140957.1 hypothetical protein [Yersinia enterocolitica]EKN5137539.1 hypothetical protein [Yersinia enterocolitica]EKN6105054.1 hypothetical protein [Yersinia enterocolitica]